MRNAKGARAVVAIALFTASAAFGQSFVNWESPHVSPIDLNARVRIGAAYLRAHIRCGNRSGGNPDSGTDDEPVTDAHQRRGGIHAPALSIKCAIAGGDKPRPYGCTRRLTARLD